MHILEEFIPDFTQKVTTGAICNRKSNIKYHEGLCFISLFNKLNVWNLNTQEQVNSFGSRKFTISTFLINENTIFIGYEDGSIEMIRDYREKTIISSLIKPHSKRISKILLKNSILISSSIDGTICHFDLILAEVKQYFKGNSSTVESIVITDKNNIMAVCGDRSVKIWNIQSEELQDAIVFNEDVFDLAVHGNEALIFLKNGNSYLIDLETKEQKIFEKFKYLRNMKMKDSKIIVQCQKNTSIFQITKESNFGLVNIKKMPTKAEYFNFDFYENEICFISKENQVVFGSRVIDFGFHKSEILDIRTDHSKIYTLSKDRIICWNKTVENPIKDSNQKIENVDDFTVESLDHFWTIEVQNANCFEFFSNSILVGNNQGLTIIEKKFNEIKETLKIGKVSSISATETHLAVTVENTVYFYDSDFKEFNSFLAPENIVYCILLNTSFICSCLDNKIYQFVFPTMELRITLYGHSLPVRNFSISTDEKLLLSCGADKLVKLWGMEFGECRKSFVGNCRNVKFLNESLFMFCDDYLHYYNGFEHLKKFRIFQPGLIFPGTDYIIVSSERGLVLLTMNKYEYIKEEDSTELENITDKNILNVRDYDAFLDHIERLEENFSEVNVNLFYNFLEKIDFNELKQYLYVLDHISILILLKVIKFCKNRNSVILSRIFLQLFYCHKDTCLGIETFREIWQDLKEKTVILRDLYNLNQAQIEMDFNGVD